MLRNLWGSPSWVPCQSAEYLDCYRRKRNHSASKTNQGLVVELRVADILEKLLGIGTNQIVFGVYIYINIYSYTYHVYKHTQ